MQLRWSHSVPGATLLLLLGLATPALAAVPELRQVGSPEYMAFYTHWNAAFRQALAAQIELPAGDAPSTFGVRAYGKQLTERTVKPLSTIGSVAELMNTALRSPEVQRSLERLGIEAQPLTRRSPVAKELQRALFRTARTNRHSALSALNQSFQRGPRANAGTLAPTQLSWLMRQRGMTLAQAVYFPTVALSDGLKRHLGVTTSRR